jgi:acyl-CoA thioester hydrolase
MQQTIPIRVRYSEVDAMGYLHHSRYFQYFEMGRIELLRSLGHSYADLEAAGVFFVVVKAECQFKAPARNDEELHLDDAD